ncbi:DnaB-like helicase C-terminal domain-containing protein, partial [Burkholderia ubonensis]|uniref:DnaB-like helicase C-terminal domain-containing protein n=1 Tax=Burkholderia ubonensis TaxID=101571 RepID=UPI000A795C1F
PAVETLLQKFPEFKDVPSPEPAKYYLDLLDTRFCYEQIDGANIESQSILKNDPKAIDQALARMKQSIDNITHQRHRTQILDLGKEGPGMVMNEYHKINAKESLITFGWPTLDGMVNTLMPGDVVSFVGRPASGKTFLGLYGALHNWRNGQNVLFASMEMNALAIAQRCAAMYAHTGLTQLKSAGYATKPYMLFAEGLQNMMKEPAKFYVLDGNLAAMVDDIYLLAAQLGCDAVWIDGAYMLKHKNPRLDRFTRVAENVEHIKQATTDLEIPTVCSWQFNREAAKKKANKQKAGLEDIGYSDAIGQISSVVLGLMQEDSVETSQHRIIDVLKGRSGETGQFSIKWDFIGMNFDEVQDGTGLDSSTAEWNSDAYEDLVAL